MAQATVSLRGGLVWAVIAFVIVLAVVIGVRLDQAALTMVVGLSCGVGVSIPLCLLILFVSKKNTKQRAVQRELHLAQPPPVIVIAPPTTAHTGQWPEQYALRAPSERQFTVFGDQDEQALD